MRLSAWPMMGAIVAGSTPARRSHLAWVQRKSFGEQRGMPARSQGGEEVTPKGAWAAEEEEAGAVGELLSRGQGDTSATTSKASVLRLRRSGNQSTEAL